MFKQEKCRACIIKKTVKCISDNIKIDGLGVIVEINKSNLANVSTIKVIGSKVFGY